MNLKNDTIQLYDALAEKSFNEWFDADLLKPNLQEFISLLGKHPRVLDMGCGVGGESKRLISLGAEVTGIDLSRKSIEYAIANVPEATFLVMDLLEMDFPDDSFEGIVEAGVLFHFSRDEQITVLENVHNILSKGGLFLSFYPEGKYEGNHFVTVEGEAYERYVRLIDKQEWIEEVVSTGFIWIKELQFNLETFRCNLFRKV